MRSLRYRLPPPNALVMFEAVARHLSFTAAAGELGVSQAATSRQIRNLEDNLDLELFRREGRRIKLTAAGEQLFAAVTMGFGHIMATIDGLRQQHRTGHHLTVASTVAFSSLWLMPRLGRFHADNPDCELRLISSDRDSDWLAEGVDVVLAYGPGSWPGYRCRRLFGDRIVAVAHPDYFGARPLPDQVADLLAETFLHTETEYASWFTWNSWFEKLGVKAARDLPGPRFSTYTLAIQAAAGGRGLALGWRRLIAPQLAEGSLLQVTDAEVVPKEGYHVLIANRLQEDRWAAAFKDWVIAEAEE